MSNFARAPLVVRVSGVSSNSMQAFNSDLEQHLLSLEETRGRLQQAQRELVDLLYSEIHGADSEKRHALLAVKRDCFNGRPLAGYRDNPVWATVVEISGSLSEEILRLETRVAILEDSFEAAFASEKDRQSNAVARLFEEPDFLCGLATSSSLVGKEVERLRTKPPQSWGRRERRLSTTLLRYGSRAAFKLSPFSTFTSTGLLETEKGAAPLQLVGGDWVRRSLVRLRRHILDRCMDMLVQCNAWRRELPVVLNTSITPLHDGLMYRQSPGFRPDEHGKLRYGKETIVRARFASPIASLARRLLAVPLSCAELIALISQELKATTSASDVAREVDRLIDLDFLQLVLPWPADDPHLEKTLLSYFRPRAKQIGAEAFVDKLHRLVDLEDGLLNSADPAGGIAEIEQLINSLLQAAAIPAALDPAPVLESRISEHDVYQDTWCTSVNQPQETIAKVGASQLLNALDSVQPLASYSRLYSNRIDFVHSIGLILAQQRGHNVPVPLLEAFELALPLWQEYQKVQQDNSFPSQTWNPRNSPALEDLAKARLQVSEEFSVCIADGPDGRSIDGGRLREVIDRHVPEQFRREHVGLCLFLQPASRDASTWVLNHMTDGTGRMSSRYTVLMPRASRTRYCQEIATRSRLVIENEEVHVLDLYCVHGDTLNVHTLQTPAILCLPGHVLSSGGRHVRLQDLVLTVNHNLDVHLRDRQGQRFLPVYVGGAGYQFLPRLVRFLAALGPGELNPIFPQTLQRQHERLMVSERTTMGNVILQRKSWRVPTDILTGLLSAPTEARAFSALSHWRRRLGWPDQVFVEERTTHWLLGHRNKPQYIDLTSPLFVSLLNSIATAADSSLVFTEMLPRATDLPVDESNRHWAAEVLVDSLALKAAPVEVHPGDFCDDPLAAPQPHANTGIPRYWTDHAVTQRAVH